MKRKEKTKNKKQASPWYHLNVERPCRQTLNEWAPTAFNHLKNLSISFSLLFSKITVLRSSLSSQTSNNIFFTHFEIPSFLPVHRWRGKCKTWKHNGGLNFQTHMLQCWFEPFIPCKNLNYTVYQLWHFFADWQSLLRHYSFLPACLPIPPFSSSWR